MNEKAKYYEPVYSALLDTIADILSEEDDRVVLTLSGGMDSRIIYGMIDSIACEVPTLSYGNFFENLVAGKVSSTHGFQHYIAQNPYQAFRYFKSKGYTAVIRGSYFDEINGLWRGHRAKNPEQFYGAVLEATKTAKFRAENILTTYCPIMNLNVIKALGKIPWQYRKGKQIQKYILRKYFPELWKIIYYDSMLPMFMPFAIHSISDLVIHRPQDFIRRNVA